jgi:hypothetical protein
MKSVTEPTIINVTANKRLAKIMGFCDMMPCSLLDRYLCIGGTSKYNYSEKLIRTYQTNPQSSSTLWNYSKCGVYTVESEEGC